MIGVVPNYSREMEDHRSHSSSSCLRLAFDVQEFLLYFLCHYCVTSFLFFFKQKTAYEMRISDWSSDVCSSDLVWSWTLKKRRTSVTYSACIPGTFSVWMCGTPGSAKAGTARIFAESGFEIWGWSFMAFSPIASPILPQA